MACYEWRADLEFEAYIIVKLKFRALKCGSGNRLSDNMCASAGRRGRVAN